MEKQLKAITDYQTRIRANLDKVPPSSAAYKRYLEKFDQQETEIEKLQKQIADKLEAEKTKRAAYEDYLAGLTVE
jgi:DNA repair exonuclease SbcCD ATPase subunit